MAVAMGLGLLGLGVEWVGFPDMVVVVVWESDSSEPECAG